MQPKLTYWLAISAGIVLAHGAQAQSWHATVGEQSPDEAVQALAFLPNEMWIHVGDSITWTFHANEGHSVTFLKVGQPRPTFLAGCAAGAPPNGTTPDGSAFDGLGCVNSGIIKTPGITYTVTFSNPGNYVVVCLLHANQSGTIHVLNASEPLPHDQDFYDSQAAVEERDLLHDHDGGFAAESDERAPGQSDEPDAHASHDMHLVVIGKGELVGTPGGAQSVSTMRFGSASVEIHAGETVEWGSFDVSGHSVTFGDEPPGGFTPLDPPSASPGAILSHDSDGALHAILTSVSDSIHSGRIAPASQERTGLGQLAPGATRFRVTFTAPGTYPYVCAFHDELGMKGEVVVLP